jgi:hypothetical protein
LPEDRKLEAIGYKPLAERIQPPKTLKLARRGIGYGSGSIGEQEPEPLISDTLSLAIAWCAVSHITVMSLRSKRADGKASGSEEE